MKMFKHCYNHHFSGTHKCNRNKTKFDHHFTFRYNKTRFEKNYFLLVGVRLHMKDIPIWNQYCQYFLNIDLEYFGS